MILPPNPLPEPTIFVVDDDPSALKAVCFLLECNGWRVEGFSSAADFLSAWSPDRHGCLLLDVRMPEMTGLELQAALTKDGSCIPIIMMSGYGDVATCAHAFRAGAVDFLEKPADHKVLLGRILEAVERDAKRRQVQAGNPQFFVRLRSLTPREREVMDRLMEGKSLKQIAMELNVSVQTSSKHRMKVLEKLRVANDIELLKNFMQQPAGEPVSV
ncbi:MAG: response regulator [Planctomycetales bacterium]|nr:response regulator [Planctomycetales bacterium]